MLTHASHLQGEDSSCLAQQDSSATESQSRRAEYLDRSRPNHKELQDVHLHSRPLIIIIMPPAMKGWLLQDCEARARHLRNQPGLLVLEPNRQTEQRRLASRPPSVAITSKALPSLKPTL
jgi:hypothetical protein